jgi:hypothetical protein
MASQDFENWYKSKYSNQQQPTDQLERSVMGSSMSQPQAQPEQIPGTTSKTSSLDKGTGAAAQTAAQGGSPLDAASQGLIMSGNPKAMAAGLALSTISQVNKQKQQNEQNRYLAEVQRVKARQDAIDRLASIGQNLRA